MATDLTAAKPIGESLVVDKRNDFSARCTWTIPGVSSNKVRQKAVWSKYFDVGGYDCRLLVYPGGVFLPPWVVYARSGPSATVWLVRPRPSD